jgi:hypothetical protein
MINTYVSCVIGAPIDTVWKVIRPFDSLAAWHPYVAACTIEGGHPSDQVGKIRRIEMHEGGIVRETLLELSDRRHSITYDIIESPMPVQNYVANLVLHEVTEGNKTFAVWSVEFDTPDSEREGMIIKLQDIFRRGLLRLDEVCRSR